MNVLLTQFYMDFKLRFVDVIKSNS